MAMDIESSEERETELEHYNFSTKSIELPISLCLPTTRLHELIRKVLECNEYYS